MNEILQKRIEEAVNFLFKQRGLDKESCRQAMYYILTNQWISVDEALPDVSEFNSYQGLSEHVFATNEESEDVIVAWYDNISKNWYQEWNGGERVQFEITHWMPIPKIGGEK